MSVEKEEAINSFQITYKGYLRNIGFNTKNIEAIDFKEFYCVKCGKKEIHAVEMESKDELELMITYECFKCKQRFVIIYEMNRDTLIWE
ncbi:MAG: hypothetical protein V3V19_11410 [Cocleimonas sp.]